MPGPILQPHVGSSVSRSKTPPSFAAFRRLLGNVAQISKRRGKILLELLECWDLTDSDERDTLRNGCEKVYQVTCSGSSRVHRPQVSSTEELLRILDSLDPARL